MMIEVNAKGDVQIFGGLSKIHDGVRVLLDKADQLAKETKHFELLQLHRQIILTMLDAQNVSYFTYFGEKIAEAQDKVKKAENPEVAGDPPDSHPA